MKKSIPLQGNSINAHQLFDVQLGDNLLEFELSYVQSGQWVLDIRREGVDLVLGAILEPNCDVIEAWRLENDIGRLIFTGDETTLENLGKSNTLVWVSPNE